MSKFKRAAVGIICFGFLLVSNPVLGQGFQVVDVIPLPASSDSRPYDPVRITFSAPVDESTINETNIRVFGSQSGRYEGTFSYEASTQTVIFNQGCAFKEGEVVSVIVQGVSTLGGGVAPSYQWEFVPRVDFGTGVFDPPEEFVVGQGGEPIFVFSGDLDGDFFTDIAVANSADASITVMINQRNRATRFSSTTRIPVGAGPYGIAGGDFNGDGLLDLVVSNLLENTLTVLENQGNAQFTETTLQTGERPLRIAVADYDNDGDQDIAVTAFGIDQVWVHDNLGSLFFDTPRVYDVGASPAEIVARDWDGDGFVDLYVGSLGDKQIDFLRNDGTGGFEAANSTLLAFTPAAMRAGDVIGSTGLRYGDGLPDLIVSAQDEATVAVITNTANPPNLIVSTVLPQDSTTTQALSLVVADIDTLDTLGEQAGLGKDYDLDIVTAHPAGGQVRAFLNSANSGFVQASPSSYPSALLAPDRSPQSIASGDFDLDGDIDVAVINSSSGKLSVLYNFGGRQAPVFFDPPLLAFGDLCLDEDSTQYVLLTNQSSLPVTVTASVDPDLGAYNIAPDTLQLLPGQVDSIRVDFTPLAASDYPAELVIQTETVFLCLDNPLPLIVESRIPLSGRGVETVMSVQPDTLRFGPVARGNVASQSTGLLNEGNIDAQIIEYILSDAIAFEVASPPVPAIAPSGGTTQIEVLFHPEVNGIYQDSLQIVTLDPCGPDTLLVILEGEGVDPLPDLIPVELQVAAGYSSVGLRQGDLIQFESSLENRFFSFPDSFLTRFTLQAPDGQISIIGDSLVIGMDVEISPGFVSDLATLDQAGVYEACFSADYTEVIEEQNEENNILCLSPFEVRALLPDLVAESVSRTDGSTQVIRPGQSIDYTGTFSNLGEADLAESFEVEFILDNNVVATGNFDAIIVGEQLTFTAPITFDTPGTFQLIFRVDGGNVIEEVLEDNNEVVLENILVEEPDAVLVAPNPFTPNGDSFNDRVGFGVAEFSLLQPVLRIFSFEGRLIRTNTDVEDGMLFWDGRDETGRDQRPGVYLFTIEDAQEVVASGHLTLAR